MLWFQKAFRFLNWKRNMFRNEKEPVRFCGRVFYQGQPVGSEKATLTEEAFSALTGADKKNKDRTRQTGKEG